MLEKVRYPSPPCLNAIPFDRREADARAELRVVRAGGSTNILFLFLISETL